MTGVSEKQKRIPRAAIEIAAGSLALGALSRLTRDEVGDILEKVAAEIRDGTLRTDMIFED